MIEQILSLILKVFCQPGPFPIVFVLIMIYNIFFFEVLSANPAREGHIISMGIKVLLLVGYLVECELAIPHWAEERSLACVNPQVVEEIVPFPEDFFALIVIFVTWEDALAPSGLDIEKFYLCKISRSRNMDSAIEMHHVNIITATQMNSSAFWLMILLFDVFDDIKLVLGIASLVNVLLTKGFIFVYILFSRILRFESIYLKFFVIFSI